MSTATVVDTTQVSGRKRENNDGLVSFAIEGDFTYRIIRDSETDAEAMILVMPFATAAGIGYGLVREVEARQTAKANTRVKED